MKRRYLIFLVMLAVTVCSAALFPRININEDMTEYLPADSRMREGLGVLKSSFPDLDMNPYIVKAMFKNAGDKDALKSELTAFEGVSGVRSVSEKDTFILYQLTVEKGADPKAIAADIVGTYGDGVVVETNANSNMPDNMVLVLIIAVILVFGILFLMCSSFVEALLFIITIGMAVVINMGTNAFLPSVSMMTNTIVAVLQLVLSMDYSIILMNRYRQVLVKENDIARAMPQALKAASPSILSSSFTTIVGLLALVFMKFRIGMDLGLVLAKGVLCSLISIYTVLPALILIFDKWIRATEKKVFLLPTDRIARFELKFRVPLSILFIVVFICSYFLSKKTELSYASIWESEIAELFPNQNLFSLVYRTDDEQRLIPLMDYVAENESVVTALSYPSLLMKQYSASDMSREILSLMSLLPGGEIQLPDSSLLNEMSLKLLYYTKSHPVRDERMSFEDIMEVAEDASSRGLLPSGMDIASLSSEFAMPQAEIAPVAEKRAEPVAQTEDVVVLAEVEPDQTVENVEELKELAGEDSQEPSPESLRSKYHFTPENCTQQMGSAELADFLGFSRGQASTIFSMAGRKGKKGTMSPYEFIHYMTDVVLNKKLLRAMISDTQAEGLYVILSEMDAAMALGQVAQVSADENTIVEDGPDAETAVAVSASPSDSIRVMAVASSAEAEEESVDEVSPLEELAAMFVSGEKFTPSRIYSSLAAAGVPGIDRNMVDMLFLYYGSMKCYDDSQTMSIEELVQFLSTEIATDERFTMFFDEQTRSGLSGLDEMMMDGAGQLRAGEWSMAAIVTAYGLEDADTFDFIADLDNRCRAALGEDYYLVGESVMYKEMKDGFRHELLILTLLTIVSIFLIVALTFRSILIPTILVMTVMTGVYVNVIVSGIGGSTMLYLAYLIVQSILMGATIDYGILFTNYYLEFRRSGLDRGDSLREAYRGSIHTIMTSGLIIVCAPYVMSLLLPDPAIVSILSSLTFGAVAAILLILFVLPAMLAFCDGIIIRRKRI